MEEQSRQRGRSRRRSLASRGSASVQSVTPSAMDVDKIGRSRQSRLSASQRMSVQPSVCGVQPGRLLELRTTLGLMRARAMLEQQIEQERQMMDEGEDKEERQKGQLLKHGKLKPLGVVSDPLMRSNSCLGIVSVNSRSSNSQRPRSCTTPEVYLGSTLGDPQNHDSEGFGKRMKATKRSYSAILPRKVTVDLTRELTANLSITKQTALIPEEAMATNTTAESSKTTGTVNNNTDKEQTQAKASHNSTSQPSKNRAQKSTNSEHDLETVDTLTGKIQILPPVVRRGELGMKVEVRRLRTFSDSVVSETASSTLAVADGKQQTGTVTANSRAIKRLPKLQEKEKKQAEKSSHVSSQSPEAREKPKDDPSDQTLHVTTSSSSLRKVSIVSLGESPSKSQHTDRHRQQRRKRRHSEGKQVGSGRLSQGWSPPQLDTIEPIVGSPLHTPRKRSQTAGENHAVGSPGDQGSVLDLEALRSQMTSPGMLISVDVNEFLQDMDADDPA